jgi:hypothetical protein
MNQNRLYISYIFKYIIITLVLFLSMRYILPFKVDLKKISIIISINIISLLLFDRYIPNITEIKYIKDKEDKEISYRLLDN